MNPPKNPPAFPQSYAPPGYPPEFGMSLRDAFAAAALQGLLASGEGVIIAATKKQSYDAIEFANAAYAYADSLLREREKHHAERMETAE